MKIDIQLDDVAFSYLKGLAKKYGVSESEIVEGFLIGYAMRKLSKKHKKLKKLKDFSFGGETFNNVTKDKS